jgi:DNA-directed RNA polymerase subunit alpha
MRIRWRGLELPSQVQVDRKSLTSTYGRFIAEPFERGFGVTVGNSLRRILLSSLEGSAITQIKLHGAQHEFTSLAGVVEDATDIVLNIKSLVVKNEGEGTKVIHVDRHKGGVVTGADVQTDGTVAVINKDHVIATLSEDVPFRLEMVVENGRGYIPASEHGANIQEIGIIPIDALFSPVVRVRYEIEETRVGQKTNYDRLILEIWTNGSITPDMALVESAKIFRKHLNPFVQLGDLGAAVFADSRAGGDPSLEAKLVMPLVELNLSVRAMNCLVGEQMSTLRDLVTRTEDQLMEVRNFGETTLNEVKNRLAELGLRLGMRVPSTSSY